MPASLVYSGSRMLTEKEPETGLTYGKLLLSPTRTYAPVMKKIFESLKDRIHGMVHCSGGGQTKILHFIDSLRVVKDGMFPVPPLFKAIQIESGTDWQEMYRVFNMGHRMEIYTDKEAAAAMIDISRSFGVDARIVGHVEEAQEAEVVISSGNDRFVYKK